MDKGTAKTLVYLAAGLGVAYLLYKAWGGISKTVSNLTAPVVNPLADWYAALTANGSPIPQGFVLLPDGSSVSTARLNIAMVPNTNSATFSYNSQTYYLNSPHDENGNWAASTVMGG